MFSKVIFRFLPYLIILGLIVFILFDNNGILTAEKETRIESTTILESIESMGKVELVKYNFKEVIEITRKTPEFLSIFKLGPDSKAVLIASGEAVGCIDLTLVTSKDIVSNSDTLIVSLPPPELCYYKVDLENTKLYSLQTGFFTEASEFVEEAYREAEKQIKQAALQSNILSQTQDNAELILKPFLEELSGKKVVLKYQISEDSGNQILHDTL